MRTGRDVVAHISRWEQLDPARCLEVAASVVDERPALAAKIIEVAQLGMKLAEA